MSENSEELVSKIATLVISVVALLLCFFAMREGYIGTEVFLLVLVGVLAAWGVTVGYGFGQAQAKAFERGCASRRPGEVISAVSQVLMRLMELKQLEIEAAKTAETKKHERTRT